MRWFNVPLQHKQLLLVITYGSLLAQVLLVLFASKILGISFDFDFYWGVGLASAFGLYLFNLFLNLFRDGALFYYIKVCFSTNVSSPHYDDAWTFSNLFLFARWAYVLVLSGIRLTVHLYTSPWFSNFLRLVYHVPTKWLL